MRQVTGAKPLQVNIAGFGECTGGVYPCHKEPLPALVPPPHSASPGGAGQPFGSDWLALINASQSCDDGQMSNIGAAYQAL